MIKCDLFKLRSRKKKKKESLSERLRRISDPYWFIHESIPRNRKKNK